MRTSALRRWLVPSLAAVATVVLLGASSVAPGRPHVDTATHEDAPLSAVAAKSVRVAKSVAAPTMTPATLPLGVSLLVLVVALLAAGTSVGCSSFAAHRRLQTRAPPVLLAT
jgi:hypothetical protein